MEQFETRAFGDVTLILGDCLAVMPELKAKSVQLCFLDLPYGVTANRWDVCLPLADIWSALARLILPNSTIAATATQPFVTTLICSNKKMFRYDLIWQKTSITGFLNAPYRPLRSHEHVLIFSQKRNTYNPQKTQAVSFSGSNLRNQSNSVCNWGDLRGKITKPWIDDGTRFPGSTLLIKSEQRTRTVHPTQKPVALLEWLIRTYTNDGDTILDPVAGSATTAIAAMNVGNRKVICIEKDPTYFKVMTKRVSERFSEMEAARAAI